MPHPVIHTGFYWQSGGEPGPNLQISNRRQVHSVYPEKRHCDDEIFNLGDAFKLELPMAKSHLFGATEWWWDSKNK